MNSFKKSNQHRPQTAWKSISHFCSLLNRLLKLFGKKWSSWLQMLSSSLESFLPVLPFLPASCCPFGAWSPGLQRESSTWQSFFHEVFERKHLTQKKLNQTKTCVRKNTQNTKKTGQKCENKKTLCTYNINHDSKNPWISARCLPYFRKKKKQVAGLRGL